MMNSTEEGPRTGSFELVLGSNSAVCFLDLKQL